MKAPIVGQRESKRSSDRIAGKDATDLEICFRRQVVGKDEAIERIAIVARRTFRAPPHHPVAPDVSLFASTHAARRLALSRRFRYGTSFFFALNTRHWTVPIGMALAAAISWYSHSSTKRSVSASCSRESRKDIQC